MPTVQRARALSSFSCLGESCPDTCCFSWSMQVDAPTLERYRRQAPELLAAVEPGEAGAPWIMRKNPATGYCVKLDGGWCGIHKAYGETFLGDACYFYPRATRRLGDVTIMTAAGSCPEAMRLFLESGAATEYEPAEAARLPAEVKDYLPPELTAAEALAVHRAFLAAAGDENVSAERAFARIAYASRAIERLGKKQWPQAAPGYLRLADGLLPPPEKNPADPFNLLHALAGLIVASHKPMGDRLKQTISDMENALCVKLDWKNVTIAADEKSAAAYDQLKEKWKQSLAAHYAPALRRWLMMQLSLMLHPFAGIGDTISDRVTLLGVRLATFKLALMCSCGMNGVAQPQEVVVRVAQSLARILDHLGDAAFSLQIYNETGWVREARLRGLLEDQ